MWRALVMLLVVAAAPVAACRYVLPQLETTPDFSIPIRDGDRPMPGLRVALRRMDGGIVAEATTNASGVAAFRRVPVGKYALVDRGTDLGDVAAVQVLARAPLRDLSVRWPIHHPPAARSLHGSIRWAYVLPEEESAATLEVRDGPLGALLRTVPLAARERDFDLRDLPKGRYALTLRPQSSGGPPLGPVLVEVDPAAAVDRFDLLVSFTSCGYMILNRATCPAPPPLRLPRLAGRVMNMTDAPVKDATLLLMDAAHAELARLQTDEQGRFASPVPLRAGLSLGVYAPFGSPLRVAIEDGSQSAPGELTVKLGSALTCSQMEVAAR